MNRSQLPVALAATAALLAACNSGTSSAPPTSATTSSAPSSVSPSSAPSTTRATPTTVPGDPHVPPAARAHTRAGARAFAVNYIAVVNETGQRPVAGKLERLALPSCKSCDDYEKQVTTLIKDHRHYSHGFAGVKGTPAISLYTATATSIYVVVEQFAAPIQDLQGNTVDHVNAGSMTFDFALRWMHGAWKIAKIYDTA